MMNKIPNNFSIFPVKDKKPLIDWKEYQNRFPSIEEKEQWKSKYTNFGIATGKISNLLVLDDDSLGGLVNKQLPKTLTQNTPRGGKHYFFKWVDELDNKITTKTEILPKIDIRGTGGYVVFYGFNTPYQYTPIAYPPKWLINLLPSRNKEKQPISDWMLDDLESIQPGPGNGRQGRTPTFIRVIGKLKNKGLTETEVSDTLTPWAEQYEYSEKIDALIKDQFKRYPPPIQNVNTRAASIDSFLENEEKVEWIVPDLIAKKSISFVVGLPESRKTWILIDLAIEAARGGVGSSWLGKFPVKGPLKVLFIDQERFKGETQRRFKAVIKGKDLSLDELKDNLFIKCGTNIRLDLHHSYEEFKKEAAEIKPDLIIIDSFATFHTKNENSRQDIQEVLERVKEIRNKYGCGFVFVHHENKAAFDKGKDSEDPSIAQMAGNVAIPAACETVLTVRKHDDSSSMIFHTKSTLSSTREPFLVRITDMDESKSKISIKGY